MRWRSRPHGQQGVQARLLERAKATEIANLRLRPWIQASRCRGQRNRLNGSLPDAAGRKEMFRIVIHRQVRVQANRERLANLQLLS